MVISIKNIKNSATCFGSLSHHQATKKRGGGSSYIACLQPLYGTGPHRLLWAGSLAAPGNIAMSYIPNCLNFDEIFIVYTQFTNAAVGRIIQLGGPRFGHPYLAVWESDTCEGRININTQVYISVRFIFLSAK